MRSVLLSAMPALIWVLAGINLILTALLMALYLKKKTDKLPLVTAAVALGLFYDALVLALGTAIGEGGLLKTLSLLRFVLHGALLPLLFAVMNLALGAGKKAMKTVWIITAVLACAGVIAGFLTKLEPRELGGVVRYASSELTPAVASGVLNGLNYGIVALLILFGLLILLTQKTPLVLLSGAAMLAFSALAPATGNADLIFFVSMFGEVLMILFLYLYALRRAAGKTAPKRKTDK